MTHGPLSILLVEDSPLDATLVSEQLRGMAGRDLTLRHAETIAQAVAAIAEDPPDCVLCDLTLPDAAGLEALGELHYAAPHVPVVVLSGAEAEDLAVRAVAEGAQDYLVKGQAPPALVLRAVRYAIERKETELELQAMALTDGLTGLPNRTRLMDRIAHALDRMSRTHTHVALLFLDLDRFKLVNDSLGHTAGDRLLLAVADRLRRAVRPADTIARFGGDEFVVLCEDLNTPAEAEIVIERIHSALATPVELEGQDVIPAASVGVAIATGPDDSPERLLRDADSAMYRAKERGSGVVVSDALMQPIARERLALESELHRALRAEELELHYQPIVRLEAGGAEIDGVEALVRWRHPQRGLLAPDAFIPAAEETGLIRRLGLWVLREACRQLAAWDAVGAGGGRLTMSVNLSPHQLADAEILDAVAAALEAHQIAPSRLCLEITESVLLDAAAGAPERLEQLKSTGVRIAMDDFGTGYASLSSLITFPIDVLKIDRSFVREMDASDSSRRIVAAVAGLAGGLGLSIVAEGVEKQVVAAELRDLGCERAQGFHFSRPVPAAEIGRLVAPPPAPGGDGGEPIRLFLCDDSEELRALLRVTLEEDGGIRVVGEASDGHGVVGAVARSGAEVVLIDLSMPRVDGLEAITALRTARPDLGIVVLSGFEQDRMRAQAIALGADRYVEKRAALADVRAAVATVADIRRGPRAIVDRRRRRVA